MPFVSYHQSSSSLPFKAFCTSMNLNCHSQWNQWGCQFEQGPMGEKWPGEITDQSLFHEISTPWWSVPCSRDFNPRVAARILRRLRQNVFATDTAPFGHYSFQWRNQEWPKSLKRFQVDRTAIMNEVSGSRQLSKWDCKRDCNTGLDKLRQDHLIYSFNKNKLNLGHHIV